VAGDILRAAARTFSGATPLPPSAYHTTACLLLPRTGVNAPRPARFLTTLHTTTHYAHAAHPTTTPHTHTTRAPHPLHHRTARLHRTHPHTATHCALSRTRCAGVERWFVVGRQLQITKR